MATRNDTRTEYPKTRLTRDQATLVLRPDVHDDETESLELELREELEGRTAIAAMNGRPADEQNARIGLGERIALRGRRQALQQAVALFPDVSEDEDGHAGDDTKGGA